MSRKIGNNKFLEVSRSFYKFLFTLFIIFGFVPDALAFVSGNYYLNTPVNFGCVNNNANYYLIAFEPNGTMGNPGDECNAGGIQYNTWGELRGIYELQFGVTYKALELLGTNPCTENPPATTNYADCLPSAISIGSFTILNERTPGSSAGFTNYHPEVKLIKPDAESKIGGMLEIQYEASDQNDANEKTIAGLGDKPVSIYYAPSYDTSARTLIAKDLPAIGTYTFDAGSLAEDFYRIIVKAEDVAGQPGEAVSPVLLLDNVAPVFRITAEPPVTRGEDVKIIVESSEDLAEAPVATVVQKNSTITVSPRMIVQISSASFSQVGSITRLTEVSPGVGTRFEGIYQVAQGFDGPAKITVSGKDKAGNVGTKLVGGGYFSVGIEPPPKPVVLSPLDKDVVASDSITVLGMARDDTEVLLLVNGKGEYKAKPDENGNFAFRNVDISSKENQGLNFLSVTARDEAGNLSEAANLTVKFNIDPEAEIIFPKKDDVLSGIAAVSISAKDGNNDKLFLTYEVSEDNGENWTVIADKTTSRRYLWNTAKHNDGEYLLRVIIDDGFSKQQIVSDRFFVSNFLPMISFDIKGDKLVFNTSEAVISGSVKTVAGKEGEARPTVAGVEYALSGAEEWTAIPASDGAYNSFEEGFSLRLSGLSESSQIILFRAQDSRGLYGRAKRILVVDFGPPAGPVISVPLSGAIISDKDDQDPNTAGVQFTVSGTAEPESTVKLVRSDLTSEVRPPTGEVGSDGRFMLQGVTLRRHGQNEFKIYAVDAAGNKSPETALSLIYNNPPKLKFLNPRSEKGLNHKAEVRWEAIDPDGDKVTGVKISYRRIERETGGNWSKLIETNSLNSLDWNVSSFAEGKYQLKLEATDGVSSSEKVIDFFIDNTLPRIELTPLKNNVFTKEFTLDMSGRAFDDFSGIEFIEFNVQNVQSSVLNILEESWFKTTIIRGFLGREAVFRIRHKLKLDDGIYIVRFRAIDAAGNLSGEADQRVIVDTKPPRIGSYTISDGAINILPEGDRFMVLEGEKVDFKISLEADTKTATLSFVNGDPNNKGILSDKMPLLFNLRKNNAIGLWETEISFTVEEFKSLTSLNILKISAEDLNGNVTKDKEIGQIEVIQKGVVASKGDPIEDAKVTVQVFDQDSQSFVDWQAEPYGKENPVFTDNNGEYSFLLPAGKYQLLIQKKKFKSLRVSEFALEQPKFVNFDFELEPRTGIRGFIEDLIETYGN